MKTKEELNALHEEYESMNKKLAELTEEELAQVAGGAGGGNSNCLWILMGASPDRELEVGNGGLKPPVHEIGAYYDAEYFELP